MKNMSELYYCNRYSSRCLVMLIVGALSAIISVRAALWQCGKPSTFNSPTDPSAPLLWKFSTESCLSNLLSLLNSTIFEVSLTSLFDSSALMTGNCRNNFYPSLSVTLTDRSRDVKLYSGQSTTGIVSILLPPTILVASSRLLYEAKVVLGPSACTESSLQFSILAQFVAASSSLIEGSVGPLLQRGKVELDRERLFKFYPSLALQINQNKRDIFIQLASLQDADLYVNPPCASGNCFYHRSLSYSAQPDSPPLWTSQRPGGDEYIPISHSELRSLISKYAALNLSDPFALYVSVYGYKPAEFTLSLTSSTTVQEWPIAGFVKSYVSESSYRYYRYVNTQPEQAIYFDLLPTYGDADLSISCFLVATGDDNGYPSRINANFSSEDYMEDSGVILPTNKYTCRPAAPEGNVYYVGVYGFGSASYTLTITRSASVITLTEGIPQSGLTVFKHIGRFFQLYLGFESASLRITLTSMNGDCDLFVKFGASGVGAGALASPTVYDYKSTNMGKAVDSIFVSESYVCQDCVVSIMVYGYYTSTFSLLASLNDGVVLLTDGLPQKGSVAAGKLQYFSFVVSSPIFGSNVSESSNIRRMSLLNQIPLSAKLLQTNDRPGNKNSKTIGIRSNDGYSALLPETFIPFNWKAKTDHPTIQPSVHSDGGEQDGDNTGEDDSEEEEEDGDNTGEDDSEEEEEDGDNTGEDDSEEEEEDGDNTGEDDYYSEYEFEPTFSPSPSFKTASPTKKRKSVNPSQQPTKRRKSTPPSASTSSATPTIGNALPPEFASVTAVLTMLSGSGGGLGGIQQPVLYMSTVYQYPNSSTPATASSKDQQNNDIQVTLPKVRRGQTVYVAVDSNRLNESFTIRVNEVLSGATHKPSLLTLLDGIPQVDSISNDDPMGWKYYPVRLRMGHEALNIRMITFVGSVDVYVKRCNLTSVAKCALYQLPAQTNYDYTTVGRGREDSLSVSRQDDTDVIYLIGVYSQSLYASYQISTTVADTVLALQAGVSMRDYVEPGKADHFSYYLNKNDEQMRVSLTTISGDPDLFVSTTIHNPTYNNATWSAVHYGSDVLVIDPKTDKNACVHCTYFITVASLRPSMYSLLLALESTIPKLSDGHPVSDHVGWLKSNIYTFADSYGAGRDIRIKLTTIKGDADMFVTLDGTSPWLGHNDYSSTRLFSSEEEIFISHADSPLKKNCISEIDSRSKLCTITIAVFGTLSSDYSISLTTNSSATTLQLDRIQSGTVKFGVDNYYRVRLSKTLSTHALPYTLRITATSRSGLAAMYISCLSNTPGYSNYIWKVDLVDRISGSIVDIDSITAQEKGCHRTCMSGGHIEYFIALHSTVQSTSAAYTISATVLNDTALQALVPGHSSIGIVAQNTLSYYYLRLSTSSGSTAAVKQAELDMTITLSILQGYADLYASLSFTRRPVFNSDTRKVDRALFSTEDESASSFVMLTTKQISLNHDRIQDLCLQNKSTAQTEDCYLVLGVLGERVASTRFSLQATFNDATKILSDGVPILGSVAKNRMEFFKFAVVSNLDLVVSITPFHGDPDVFLSLSQPYPNRGNFTWSQTRTTADTLTIQSTDLARHGCHPAVKVCTLYIGVYGFQNSTYSMVVSTNQGFITPIALMDEQMQSGFVSQGQYVYYRYIISTDASNRKSSIKFLLTPTDGGDQDLYVRIGPLDSHGQPVNSSFFEPGLTQYDYKSAGWSSTSEDITIGAGLHGFCEHCVVYVAVYGYKEGHFTIQASSRGIIALPEGVAVGGRVQLKEYSYYSFYNSIQFAQISIALTMISGDGDLYISTADVLPSKNDYIWKSSNFGNDVFKLSYDDGLYCTACTYVVGVYGYKNSSFTIMVTTSAASIVKLKPNIPQVIAMEKNQASYFSSLLASSAADTTVTLTALNSGSADLYIQIYNASTFTSAGGGDQYVLPDPNDPSTYKYTTKRTADNHVFVPAAGQAQELVAIITVFATTSLRCTIIVTSTQFPVLLQLGIPQNQFVELGQTEHFVVYPDELEDLRISVTGRSGDPDLLVSTNPNRLPRCTIGSNSWSISCGNYTWSSRLYSTDQIILSQENPCAAVLTSTHVDPSCDPLNSYDPANHKPVYIGVFGYKASKFSILVSAVGQQIQLLAGQPMLSSTSIGYICSDRSATGACLSSSLVQDKIQVSYFSFRVSSPHTNNKHRKLAWSTEVSEVLITVVPRCNASSNQQLVNSNSSYTLCSPGCDCNPLLLTINSCPSSQCSATDRKPSWLPNQHQAMLAGVAMGTGSSLVLRGASSSGPASNGYCDPVSAGEDCIYYISIAVSKSTIWNEFATFTVTARTPADVTLIPCDSQIYPDGIKAVISDTLSAGGNRYYEICGSADDDLLVSLKECTGTTRMYACSDDGQCASVLPTTTSWGFYADVSQSCVHSWSSPSKKDVCTPQSSNQIIQLQLPKRAGNYFILVQSATVSNAISPSYKLTVQALKNGKKNSPQLMFTGIQDDKVLVSSIRAHEVSLTMRQSWILLPGARSLIPPDLIVYRVFIGPVNGIPTGKSIDQIQCTADDGFNVYMYSGMKILKLTVPFNQVGGAFLRLNISSLVASERYWILVQAYCDGACLQQVSKLHPVDGSTTSCNSATTSCQTQSIFYSSTTFSTLLPSPEDEASDSGGISDTSSSHLTINAIVLSLVVVLACALALLAAFVYWKRNVSPTSEAYEWLTLPSWWWGRKDMDDSAHSSAEMISMERSSHISSYQPPTGKGDNGQGDSEGWRGAMGKMVGLVQQAPRKILGDIKLQGSAYSKASEEEIDFR